VPVSDTGPCVEVRGLKGADGSPVYLIDLSSAESRLLSSPIHVKELQAVDLALFLLPQSAVREYPRLRLTSAEFNRNQEVADWVFAVLAEPSGRLNLGKAGLLFSAAGASAERAAADEAFAGLPHGPSSRSVAVCSAATVRAQRARQSAETLSKAEQWHAQQRCELYEDEMQLAGGRAKCRPKLLCLLSWIPVLGLLNYWLHRDAPTGSRRERLATLSLLVACIFTAGGVLFIRV
jgi:hypothetical protein